jgi:hypothetical protein
MQLGATAVTMATAIALLAPAVSHAAKSQRDEVSGSASQTDLNVVGTGTLTVNTFSDPLGRNPGGVVHGSGDADGPGPMEPFDVQGKVTCLRVVGKYASIKYRFDQAAGSLADFRGGGVEVFIQDNGEPRNGKPVDANSTDLPQDKDTFPAGASQCDDPRLRPYNKVESGDYVVRDVTG